MKFGYVLGDFSPVRNVDLRCISLQTKSKLLKPYEKSALRTVSSSWWAVRFWYQKFLQETLVSGNVKSWRGPCGKWTEKEMQRNVYEGRRRNSPSNARNLYWWARRARSEETLAVNFSCICLVLYELNARLMHGFTVLVSARSTYSESEGT